MPEQTSALWAAITAGTHAWGHRSGASTVIILVSDGFAPMGNTHAVAVCKNIAAVKPKRNRGFMIEQKRGFSTNSRYGGKDDLAGPLLPPGKKHPK